MAKLTCRQHCGALNLEKPPALMTRQDISKTATLLAVRWSLVR